MTLSNSKTNVWQLVTTVIVSAHFKPPATRPDGQTVPRLMCMTMMSMFGCMLLAWLVSKRHVYL